MDRRSAIVAALAALVVVAWGAVDSWRGFLTTEHDVVVSTPGLGPLEQRYEASLRPGGIACVRPVTLTPESRAARFRVNTKRGGPVPVEIVARGPGYRASNVVRDYPSPGDHLPIVPLTPPPRELQGEVCARNVGERPLAVVGTQEIRSLVAAELLVNGAAVPGKDLELTMLEAERRTLLERPGDLVAHAQTLAADFTPRWLLWVVLVLVVPGIPLAAAAGLLALSRRRD
jgi:hypothetical protein